MEHSDDIDLERRLELRCQIADAQLGVAEEIGWIAALFAAFATYLKWSSWLLAIAAGVIVYIVAVRRYDKQRDAAWDAYERAINSGKYFQG